MKSILYYIAPALLAATALVGCENTTGEIGNSLLQTESEIIIHNEFNVEGHTTLNERIESRTITQLLGDIDAEGYGKFSADFVCQFMPSTRFLPDGVPAENIDSMKLVLGYPNGGYVGDSIAPMGLEVFMLDRQLPNPIFSTFDPAEYCDLSATPLASKIYVGNAMGQTDSIQALSYREIYVDLPVSLARRFYDIYQNDPAAVALPSTFARYFPGIYVRNSFGAGRVTQIQQTTVVVYYHTTSLDADGKTVDTPHNAAVFTVSPEVVSNNNISFTIDESLQARIDNGEQIIVAPVGRDVEITFPLKDVIDYYLDNSGPLAVVNTLTLTLPAEKIDNNYSITHPESLLMVLSSEKDKFFLENQINNNRTSFIATYSADKGGYVFSGLRTYFLDMLKKYTENGRIDPADITFTLTPVTLTTESTAGSYYTSSTTYVSSVVPYIGKPAMTRLNLDKADITFQFSKYSAQ